MNLGWVPASCYTSWDDLFSADRILIDFACIVWVNWVGLSLIVIVYKTYLEWDYYFPRLCCGFTKVEKRGQRWAPQCYWLLRCRLSTNFEIANNWVEKSNDERVNNRWRQCNYELWKTRNKQRASQVRCSKTAKMSNLFAEVEAADLHSRSVWAREKIESMRPFVGALARLTRRVTVASVKLPFGETGATIQIFMRISNSSVLINFIIYYRITSYNVCYTKLLRKSLMIYIM